MDYSKVFKAKELPPEYVSALLETEDARIAKEGIKAILRMCGDDPNREGLLETPKRVVKALLEMTGGMHLDPLAVLGAVFKEGIHYDEIVLVRGIETVSVCEHHLIPFQGYCDIAVIPNPDIGVLGLSKYARLVDVLSRRPQVQERLGVQIADALEAAIQPAGVAVRITAKHGCMSCRGVRKQNSDTVTQVLRGAFRDNADSRAELMDMLKA
jgi:GTP cyclohydrolase I